MSVRTEMSPPLWASAPVFDHCHGEIFFLICRRSFLYSSIFVPLEPPMLFVIYSLLIIYSLAEAWCLVWTQVHWQDCGSQFLKHGLLVWIMRSYDPSGTAGALWRKPEGCSGAGWLPKQLQVHHAAGKDFLVGGFCWTHVKLEPFACLMTVKLLPHRERCPQGVWPEVWRKDISDGADHISMPSNKPLETGW